MKSFLDLNLIEKDFWERIKGIKYNELPILYNYEPKFDIYAFPQTWGSTALGFVGIGGQAITKALTTVIIHETVSIAGVYFNGELAYIIKDPNQNFVDDLNNRCMTSVMNAGKYERKDE